MTSLHFPASAFFPRRHRLSTDFLTAVALILLGLVLRGPLTAVSPIVSDLKTGFGIDATTIGLMTSLPVLCFGVLTPFASILIARTSVETAILITLTGALCGLVLRSTGGIGISMAGTVLIGAALTVGNIVALMVIARDFTLHKQLMTGIYTASLNVGTMLTTAMTAPIALVCGWRVGLASSAVFVIPALALWIHVVNRRAATPQVKLPEKAQTQPGSALWRRPLVWLLILAFACHLMVYYSLTAWLPNYYITATGMAATTAGMIGALFQILALIGAFGAPVLAKKLPVPWLLVLVAASWILTPAGFLLAPYGFVLWSVLGGIAAGGGFTVIFVLIMQHARSLDENRRMSAAVQGGGYTLSALGPILMGYIHQATGSWSPAFFALSAAACVMLLCGLGVSRLPPAKPVAPARQ